MKGKLIMAVADSDQHAPTVQYEWFFQEGLDAFVESIRTQQPELISEGDVRDDIEVDTIVGESDRYIATVCDQIEETLQVYEKI